MIAIGSEKAVDAQSRNTDETEELIEDVLNQRLAAYVAGALPEPLQVFFEAHLQMSDRHHALVADLEAAAGAMLELEVPADCPECPQTLDHILSLDDPKFGAAAAEGADVPPAVVVWPAPDADVGMLPAPVRELLDCGSDDIEWARGDSGLGIFGETLKEGYQVKLAQLHAGGRLEWHSHEGDEYLLVLAGSFSTEAGVFSVGDVCYHPGGIFHSASADAETGCTCLVVIASGDAQPV
ncbi:MAG: cupin domain-containing protein [Hyphomicrobiales bacterium]